MQLLQWLDQLRRLFPNASIDITAALFVGIVVFILLAIIELDRWLGATPTHKKER